MDLDAALANKAIPPLRQSDLYTNITSPTRYEKNLAAASDEELVIYWWAWASISLFAGLFVLVVLLALLSSRNARQQPFNLYLVYLMVPDLIFSILCAISCFLNASNGSYWSHWMCNFQHWYAVFGIGSNCWLNAVITYQLHQLLRSSNIRRKFIMPSNRTVTMQSLAVYIYCGFLGTWGLFGNLPNYPYHPLQVKGLACIPVDVDVPSSLFFWLIYMPLFSLIPITYIVYVSIDIWRRELLPPAGKRRLLAVYFGRIVMVFLVLWGPYFLITYILSTWLPTSVFFAGGVFAHLQCPISAAVSMLKPDIYVAVKQFVTCQCCSDTNGMEGSSDWIHTRENSSSFMGRSFTLKRMLFGSSSMKLGLGGQSQDQDQHSEMPSQERHLNHVSYASVWPNEDGDYTSDDEELEEERKVEGGSAGFSSGDAERLGVEEGVGEQELATELH